MESKVMKVIVAVAGLGAFSLIAADAQTANVSNQYPGDHTKIPAEVHATIADPAGAPPDPANVPFVLPKDMQWKQIGNVPGEGEQSVIYGDPGKPGPYAVIYRWHPGVFSRPHYHEKLRHIVVLSGTWWVSSSSVYDEKNTYPLPAGSTAIDEPNTIHWDGARSGEKEPALVYVYGDGPAPTVYVDTSGKMIPPVAGK